MLSDEMITRYQGLVKKRFNREISREDAIKNGEIQLVINTPVGRDGKHDDSYIRMMAIQRKIPYVTSIAAAQASVEGIEAVKRASSAPLPLQEYHRLLESTHSTHPGL